MCKVLLHCRWAAELAATCIVYMDAWMGSQGTSASEPDTESE